MQGVLIRFKQTKKITYGTVIRLFASGGTVIGLAIWGEWPGVYIGTTAWMTGVVAEAIYATIAVRPLLKNQLAPGSVVAEGPILTYRDLFWFHLPLAGTSVLVLLVQPLVTFSLARLGSTNPIAGGLAHRVPNHPDFAGGGLRSTGGSYRYL